jgi:predicted nucleic acid-binding protein
MAIDVILDANVMGAYLFPEGNTADAVRVMDSILSGAVNAFVPSLFWAEVQQICYQKTQPRGNRIPVALAVADAAYARAGAFALHEFTEALVDYRMTAWDLMRALGLGSYDAYYLALALDVGIPVWTFDQKFRDPVDAGPYQGAVLLIGQDVTV